LGGAKMLKSCSACGRIHEMNKNCYKGKIKKDTKSNKFRNTNKWHMKSREIKSRDNYLCQICIEGKYDTDYVYNYNQLEVHHIVPIEDDYSLKLDNNNLITLCKFHHVKAEEKIIPTEELKELIEKRYPPTTENNKNSEKSKPTAHLHTHNI